MAKKKIDPTPKEPSVGTSELAQALVAAINQAKPVEKKNPFNRKVTTPWTSKDGTPKLKLKRTVYQHGLLVDPDKLSNDEIAAYNKLRPGSFLDGFVRVTRRKDRGIDITYPVKTASQRLKLVNQFGVRNLKELLEMCANEAENPRPEKLELD